MSKDLYIEVNAHFGIESVENLGANRRNRFINRFCETDNYFYLLRLFNFCLLNFFSYVVLPYTMVK